MLAKGKYGQLIVRISDMRFMNGSFFAVVPLVVKPDARKSTVSICLFL
jgi:hypothetical protein